MATQPTVEKAVPAVIIVGAGLGGLLLGALLEQVNIPYHIFERATKVRPLGSAMALGPGILSVFEQLGLYEDLKKIAFPCFSMDAHNDKMELVGSINLARHEDWFGFRHLVFARPDLYELLQKQVPLSKISMKKKVLRTEEKGGRVVIHCSDNTSYEGDMLVGADGAYSGVRQSLYKDLAEKGLLPKEDSENFSIGFVNMVGVTTPKNPEKYEQLKDDFCHFSSVLGERGHWWAAINVPGPKICWVLGYQIAKTDGKEQQFRNSEWGSEANDAMITEFESLPCPWGGTMGEIMRETPEDLISKVFIEEKTFKTWYHGRTVLLGDAAHKMTPSAGLGAVNAMQDAVVLANCIFRMDDATPKSMTSAFQEYYKQRYARCKQQCELSNKLERVMGGQTLMERALRYIMHNIVPEWLLQRAFVKGFDYRPQIAWLPLAQNRGTTPVLPQEGERRDIVDKTKAI